LNPAWTVFWSLNKSIQYPVKSFTPYLGGRRGWVPSGSLRKFLQEVNLYNSFKHFRYVRNRWSKRMSSLYSWSPSPESQNQTRDMAPQVESHGLPNEAVEKLHRIELLAPRKQMKINANRQHNPRRRNTQPNDLSNTQPIPELTTTMVPPPPPPL
jgi:hypothetical protein